MTEPSTRRRPGRPRAAESPATDEQILHAALRAFATHGYEGVSVRDLNTALGVSHNLIHTRYGSKASLWTAVADRYFGELVDELDALLATIGPGEPLDALRTYLVGFVEASARRPELMRMMVLEAAIDSERIDHVWTAHVGPLLARVSRTARGLRGAERFTRLPAATVFFLLAHGATAPAGHVNVARRLEPDDPRDPVVLRRHADVVADLLLGVDPLRRLDGAAPPARRTGRSRA